MGICSKKMEFPQCSNLIKFFSSIPGGCGSNGVGLGFGLGSKRQRHALNSKYPKSALLLDVVIT